MNEQRPEAGPVLRLRAILGFAQELCLRIPACAGISVWAGELARRLDQHPCDARCWPGGVSIDPSTSVTATTGLGAFAPVTG